MAEKILLVDDEEGIRKVLGISLADGGYEVFTAESGEKALNIYKEQRPPIVLTDIKMPGMDGIELLKKIKAEDPDTEVVMITGHGDMDLAIQSLKFDATDFITKPINDEALEIALKRANEKIELKYKLREYTENLEELVREKTEKLLEAERLAAVGETVAGLAHAIKNITGGLTGGAFVLEQGIQLKNEKYLFQGWEMIKGNVAKIKNMALDLLNYTKEREPDYQRLDPNTPLQEAYELMLPRAGELGIALVLEVDEGLDEIQADPEGIHRTLLNLIANAVDACTDSETNTGEDRVVLRSLKKKGWGVEYQITDNGCGMNPETRSKVFHRFFSTKGSRGTGLGLMITKKIIDEHMGEIDLTSEPEKGTTFFIRLPKGDAVRPTRPEDDNRP